MNVWQFPGLLLVALVPLAGCTKTGSTPAASSGSETDPVQGHLLHAQPKLPTIKVWLGDQELIAEIARQPVEIATGMMFRTNMLENEAMLFVFPDIKSRSFYMRNCVVPLSAAYISPDGEILEIIQLQPHDEIEELLPLPTAQPGYRQNRAHTEFLTNLSLPAKDLKAALKETWQAPSKLRCPPVLAMARLANEKYDTAEWNFKF